MWSDYQLEMAVKHLSTKVDAAWENLTFERQYRGYTLSTPIDEPKHPDYLRKQTVWYNLKRRLESAERYLARRK